MSKNTHIILIHGMWSTPEVLAPLHDFFVDLGYSVDVPRLPFHFSKEEMDDVNQQNLITSSVSDYLDELQTVINDNRKPVILVGHSMGGLLAQLLAARNPCAGLILLSSAAPAGINPWSWSVVRTFGANLFKMPLWKHTTKLKLDNISYGIANTLDSNTQQDILAASTYESGKVSWQIANWYLYRNPTTHYDARDIQCPVLIIGGCKDKITPIHLQRKIAQKINQATLHELSDACHWTVSGKHFDAVQTRITSWLSITIN